MKCLKVMKSQKVLLEILKLYFMKAFSIIMCTYYLKKIEDVAVGHIPIKY